MNNKTIEKSKSFKEIANDPVGTIYYESMEGGIKFIILRGPCSLCAYLGIPKDHPLAGFDYDVLPISCHGGLTFSGNNRIKELSTERHWYGWDYAHAGDRSFYDLKNPLMNSIEEHEWTIEEVIKDSWDAQYEMEKLMKLAEGLFRKIKWNMA